MRRRVLLLSPTIGILLASSSTHAVPVHHWSKRFGDANYQSVSSAAMDASGNVIIAAEWVGLAKFDASGNPLWSRPLGSVGYSIATDGSGNIVVCGVGASDMGGGPLIGNCFLAKFDASGNHVWSKGFGGNEFGEWDVPHTVAVDVSGNVVITGEFNQSIDFGGGLLTSAGEADIFVAKFDADGNHVWSKRFGDYTGQFGHSVAVDVSGELFVTGYFFGTLDFGGGPLTGSLYVAKLDAGGNHTWSKAFATGIGYSVAADNSGNVVVTGLFYDTVDFGGGPLTSAGDDDIFIAKFEADGDHLWSQRFGDGHFNQVGNSIAVDGSNNVVVTGALTGTADFGGGPISGGMFVTKFGDSGNHLWSKAFASAGRSIATDNSGNVVVTGWFYGTVDFGGGPLTSAGLDDIFLVKFMEGPLPVRITNFEARTREGAIEIIWDVWSDEALESFTLYRSDDAHPQTIVIAEGPFEVTTRSYIDSNVEPGKTYHYELLIRTTDGDDIRSLMATVAVPRFESTLAQNFPNPFTPSTTIEYTLSERSSAVLGIYDAAGGLIARLDQGVREAGTHRVEWNGRAAKGRLVGSGVYFYRLEGRATVAPRKMVLVR